MQKDEIKAPTTQPDGADEPSRLAVWRMFDRIAPRYDLLNRLLSLRRDVAWRNRLARYLPGGGNLTVLDLATGTADVLLSLFRNCGRIESGVGIDLAPKMLELGRQKVAADRLSDRIALIRADAAVLPFCDRSFSVTTIAFGIRNMPDVLGVLSEMYRVLRPGGRALILEFSMPRNWLMRCLYPFHLRGLIPRLGRLISGDAYAYRYLNETVEAFPYGEQFSNLMRQAGFAEINAVPLTLGVATIYDGTRPRRAGVTAEGPG